MSTRVIKGWPWIWKRVRVWNNFMDGGVEIGMGRRRYSTKDDLRKLRPMIMKRIEERAGFYPVNGMIPVARGVVQARTSLIHGVSTLLKRVPVLACKFCTEVYIGEKGHLIRTCIGSRRLNKNMHHQWIQGALNDIIVPVETFHLENRFQGEIKHDQRFDFDRIPAVLELCWQAGANPYDKVVEPSKKSMLEQAASVAADTLSNDDLNWVANETLRSWETVRSGVQKLLLIYQAKVCKHCSEVYVGPSGHKARLYGILKYDSLCGIHTFGTRQMLMIWCHLRLPGGGGLKTLLSL